MRPHGGQPERSQPSRPLPESSSTESTQGELASHTNDSDLPLFHAQRRDVPSQRYQNTRTKRKGLRRHLMGWRVIVLGSWLNVLLFFLPISWVLSVVVPDWATVIFACCTLSLIPLVKLHEISTMELSLRLGSSKTGLINATMGNLIEIVVAFSALRKCELKVVQSALLGSMLSKLLLVLGMCFFAGGLRFSEQDFDSTATQIHTSLLSISVGAVILPTAYHFSLHAAIDTSPDERRSILRMSRGVSIILLFIYMSYLLFQLWSHTHLYADKANSSPTNREKAPVQLLPRRRNSRRPTPSQFSSQMSTSTTEVQYAEKATTRNPSMDSLDSSEAAFRFTSPERPKQIKLYSAPMMSRSETTLAGSSTGDLTEKYAGVSSTSTLAEEAGPTVRLVGTSRDGMSKNLSEDGQFVKGDYLNEPANPHARLGRKLSPVEEVTSREERGQSDELATSTCGVSEEEEGEIPRISAFLTIILLIFVTIMVVLTADELVETLDEISKTVKKQWIGLILLPAVTSVAELVTAVNVSVKDQLAFSINLAVGSTIQTALFVIPLMVSVGWAMDRPLSLLFDPFESVVLYISVQTMSYVVADGKSNWLEGMILICLYTTIAVAFWYYPGANLAASLTTCP